MVLNLDMIDFIRECLIQRVNEVKQYGDTKKEWYVRFDDKYNLKYAFYTANKESINIISSYTLYEYGQKVVTISGDLVDGIIKGAK